MACSGLDFFGRDADDQNTICLCHEFRRLRVSHLHRIGRLLKHIRDPRMSAVRAGQRPAFARDDPLDVVGDQRQQSLLVASSSTRFERRRFITRT
jgi:hypothetical protein